MREADLERDILDYLNYMGGCFFRTHDAKHRPCTPGMPDIVGVRNGQMWAIEVKRPGQKANMVQMDFLTRLRHCGAKAFVATSIADVQAEMK
jgi:Holliday junction resolvase